MLAGKAAVARLVVNAALLLVVADLHAKDPADPCVSPGQMRDSRGNCVTVRAPQSGTPWTLGRVFDRVLIIVLENQDFGSAIKHATFGDLAKRGRLFNNFHGSFHPSYPNYLAMVGGKYFGTTTDDLSSIDSSHLTIAHQLEQNKLTWAQYAERYPGKPLQCFVGKEDATKKYQRRHVPFLSF